VAAAAWQALAALATPRKRLALSGDAANRVALDLLDACAKLPEDNPGATLAGSVVEVIGTKVASMEFDSGVPGSGHVLEAWRVPKKIVVTGDDTGAVAIYDDLDDVLTWWIREWEYADMHGSGVKVSFIRRWDWCPATTLTPTGRSESMAAGGSEGRRCPRRKSTVSPAPGGGH
jgi:hypothetical protein